MCKQVAFFPTKVGKISQGLLLGLAVLLALLWLTSTAEAAGACYTTYCAQQQTQRYCSRYRRGSCVRWSQRYVCIRYAKRYNCKSNQDCIQSQCRSRCYHSRHRKWYKTSQYACYYSSNSNYFRRRCFDGNWSSATNNCTLSQRCTVNPTTLTNDTCSKPCSRNGQSFYHNQYACTSSNGTGSGRVRCNNGSWVTGTGCSKSQRCMQTGNYRNASCYNGCSRNGHNFYHGQIACRASSGSSYTRYKCNNGSWNTTTHCQKTSRCVQSTHYQNATCMKHCSRNGNYFYHGQNACASSNGTSTKQVKCNNGTWVSSTTCSSTTRCIQTSSYQNARCFRNCSRNGLTFAHGQYACYRTSGTSRQRVFCYNGGWRYATSCSSPLLCVQTKSFQNATCKSLCPSLPTCSAGTRRCKGKDIEVCDSVCRVWKKDSTCGANQYCAAGRCKACVCTPNQYRCSGTRTRQRCNAACTGWVNVSTCSSSQFCSNGSCQACLCQANQTRCNGKTIQKCKAECNGWYNYFTCNSSQFCASGFCKACACTPGEKSCKNGEVAVCKNDCSGWMPSQKCASGQFCVKGSCRTCACNPGSTRCNGNRVETCQSDCQSWSASQACPSGTYCSTGACRNCSCQPGSKRCSSNQIQTCQPDCQTWNTTTVCPASQTCESGSCKSCLCNPGTRRCYGSKIQVCDSACMKWNEYHTCQQGQFCTNGACKSCICKPGTKRCNGLNAEVCSSTCTSWNKVQTCSNGDQCVAGSCHPAGWCPDYKATQSAVCNGKICQYYKCTTHECTENTHCSAGQLCQNNQCKNTVCTNSSEVGVYSSTCSNRSKARPYCAKLECRECEYNYTTGLRTNSCSSRFASRPYCAKYQCRECPSSSFTTYAGCTAINSDYRFCVDYKCGQCPSKWNPQDNNYCGGLPCKDYVCMQCSNSSNTPILSNSCTSKSPGTPYCKRYQCVECPDTNQASNVCASKYKSKGFCNANNACVQCTENGFSAYCQRNFKKDYCSNGTCVECPSFSITSSKVCATKYPNQSKPYCYQNRCVECPHTGSTGTYDATYCYSRYAGKSTPVKQYCVTNRCTECPYMNAQKTTACPANKNICSNYTCYQCVSNSNCANGYECHQNKCVQSTQQCGNCRSDSWCAANASTGAGCGSGKVRCRPKDNTCVQCLLDSDCPGQGMRCNSNNVCEKSTCPTTCSSDLDCLQSVCGGKTRCVGNVCTDVAGVGSCQPPNLLLIVDVSCSMKFGAPNLVNTGQQCSSKSDCINSLKSMDPPYTARHTQDSQVQCVYDSNKGHNTCRLTRWDVAASALRKVIKNYGGDAAFNYKNRKVRFGLVFFSGAGELAAPIYRDPPELLKLFQEKTVGGGTRYDRAFTTAKTHLVDALKKDVVTNRKTALLFLTDGAPNEGCIAGPQKVREIYNLKDADNQTRKIKTYTVGFGSGLGTAGENCLDDLAEAGQTSASKCNTGRCLKFYAADSAASLSDAIQDIINQTTKEECDGLDNDCDGIIDNNVGGGCSCIKSFSRPTSTSILDPNSKQRQAGVKLFTFIASFDVQGTCPDQSSPEMDQIKKYAEACRNNPTVAVSCTPSKFKQTRPAGDAYQFYCNRCCNSSGSNTCTWSQDHACRTAKWGYGSTCISNCRSWCETMKQKANDCLRPRGFLRRSGTGYDSTGKLTILSVSEFGGDVLSKQKERWLFVNLPNVDHRKQSMAQRPLIADVQPDNYKAPTATGTTWSNSVASSWAQNFKFVETNDKLTAAMLGIEHCTGAACTTDKNELIWTILGYHSITKAPYATHRLGAIYHSNPAVSPPPRDIFQDREYKLWLQEKIPTVKHSNVTVAERPSVVYVGSNDGIIHAFSTETGLELWGVIPATILHKLRSVPNGHDTDGSRLYTVDGSPLVQDIQMYRKVVGGEVVAKWRTVLLTGFRAGGRGYIAIDVTNPYKPRILWEINNKSAKDPEAPTAGTFDQLGYTYGQAFLANLLLNWKGNIQERAVAILPGGVKLKRRLGKNIIDQNETSVGAVIYIVDLETGTLIRQMSAEGARGFASTPAGFGVPPAPTTRAFVGDVMGRLYRIDLQNPNPSFWKMEKFYDLFPTQGETPMPIMVAPSLSLNARGEIVLFGGTGNIENVNFVRGFNKIYSLREKISLSGGILSTIQAIPNFITKLDKYLTNENTNKEVGPEVTIKSPLGERITGPPQVFNGAAYFTTYTPTTNLPICGVPGFTRVYGIHFNDQCQTGNCFEALLPQETRHFYHHVLGYVSKSVTPLKCCETDGICSATSEKKVPSDDAFLSDPKTCGDLHYTVPMLQDSRTAHPFQYHRYLSMGNNTLVMGTSFTYNPGEVNVSKLSSELQGHTYQVKHESSHFLSFQVAGKSTASTSDFTLHGLRAVAPTSKDSLKSGNYTTLRLSAQAPPILVTSWGSLLE